jgi:hypothetical protein
MFYRLIVLIHILQKNIQDADKPYRMWVSDTKERLEIFKLQLIEIVFPQTYWPLTELFILSRDFSSQAWLLSFKMAAINVYAVCVFALWLLHLK